MASKEIQEVEAEIHKELEPEEEMEEVVERERSIRQKRKLLRGRITRTINRLLLSMTTGKLTEKRAERELVDLKEDYKQTLSLHSEFYDFKNPKLDLLNRWENELSDDVYGIEEKIQEYLERETAMKVKHEREIRSSIEDIEQTEDDQKTSHVKVEVNHRVEREIIKEGTTIVDAWIDDLVEYTETKLNQSSQEEMSIAQALYRLEASRDTPTLQLKQFDGNAMQYVEFIETFRIHIHQKGNLTDDHRMGQLKMHLTGEAARSISGLGSSGIMYATALKTIKEQFGHPSRIARTFIMQLTKGDKIRTNDCHSLRNFSIDVINCLATLTRINYLCDVNTIETLRQIIQRLPDHLILKWKNTVTDIRERGRIPDLGEISKFLRRIVKSEFDPDFGDLQRIHRHECRDRCITNQTNIRKGVHTTEKAEQRMKCYHCGQNHRINNCPAFLNLPISERVDVIKKNKLCFSCLVRGHGVKECRSKRACGKNGCLRVHNELIHYDSPNTCISATSALDQNGILPVVRVTFRAANGRTRDGNVLIDGGAGTTIIRTKFAKDLGLHGKREHIELSVVGGKQVSQKSSRRVKFWISPLHDKGREFDIEAHEIDTTVNSVGPLNRKWLSTFKHLKGLEFPHQEGPIDMVLGVQYSHLHADQEVREGKPYEPIAKLSKLGWCVMGSEKKENAPVASINFVQKIDIEKMYELETIGIQAPHCTCPKSVMSSDDRRALELLESSCKKEGERYVIGLPWKRDKRELPNNYKIAERRLLSLERNLQRDPKKAELYCKAMEEYEINGWSEEVLEETSDTTYYLPHHGVYRPEKTSTPLRVVFDPACYCEGVSLNSFLYKGPSLLGNLFATLLRFREEPVAFVGDISKMYLQIRLLESDTQVHRYLWRNLDSSREPSIYRIMRVTFGDKSSPDMANFVMLKIADDNQEKHPEVAKILRDDRYMDDILHSCTSDEKASELIRNLDRILDSGSFKIKQWISSAKGDQRETQQPTLQIPDSNEVQESVKTLGVLWNYNTDTFHFRVKNIILQEYTRRSVLSHVAQLYDPLGLAAVVTIRARIAMQNLWKLRDYTWDDSLPDEQCELWRNIFKDLENLNGVQYRRCLKPEKAIGKPELHVFADASNNAYGSCAYLLWRTNGPTSVKLIAAKARVAPLRLSTIPRLELMAALIASRLARTIQNSLRSNPEVYLWSDSRIVLHWLDSESSTLKPFVGVRVAEIQAEWPVGKWRYVPTRLNPADDLSRGVKVEKIKESWFEGPEFLRQPETEWPVQNSNADLSEDTEVKKAKKLCYSVQTEKEPFIDCQKFSSWQKLLHVTAYCFRFIKVLKEETTGKNQVREGLQPEEIQKAENYWIIQAQRSLNNWSKNYAELSPFEQDGLIRVGGRLRHSPLDYEQRHPVLLPASHHISALILRCIHEKLYHAGAERTLTESRRKYWFLRGRNAVKYLVRNCTICRKLRQPPHEPFMSDLPAERVNLISPPFTTTGVDLFGPFHLRNGRNKKIKAWGAIFTCAVTRAIHLEIVENLSTDSFLHALRRFTANHGWPSTMISDNGTSFVGASKEVKVLFTERREKIQEFSSKHRMKWRFTTPLSPHQGGIYESMIKQVKRAIQVSVGSQVLTWNEMATVFAEVKGLINSRPLGFSSSDPNDLQPLTPNHFLIGRASTDVPQIDFTEVTSYRRRFEFVQCLVSQIWRRFIRGYLPTLMSRTKWRFQTRQVRVGDIILLVDYNLPRGQWQLARITEVFPGTDGTVRNVAVKTQHGVYKRSVQKCIVVLENNVDN